jgi:hypothetical protein
MSAAGQERTALIVIRAPRMFKNACCDKVKMSRGVSIRLFPTSARRSKATVLERHVVGGGRSTAAGWESRWGSDRVSVRHILKHKDKEQFLESYRFCPRNGRSRCWRTDLEHWLCWNKRLWWHHRTARNLIFVRHEGSVFTRCHYVTTAEAFNPPNNSQNLCSPENLVFS